MPFDARFADFFASFPDRNGNVDHPIGEAEMEATARRFVAAHYPEPGILALTETSVRPLIHVGPHNTRAPSVEFRFAQVLDNGVKTYNEAVVIVDSTFGSVVSYDAAYYPVTADRTPRIGPTKAAATAIKALALSEAVVTDSTLIVSRPDDAGREALCYALTVQGDAKPGDAGSFATCRAVVDACNGRVLGVER
jgi:hypothetical protein